jgi:hypothetical protein
MESIHDQFMVFCPDANGDGPQLCSNHRCALAEDKHSSTNSWIVFAPIYRLSLLPYAYSARVNCEELLHLSGVSEWGPNAERSIVSIDLSYSFLLMQLGSAKIHILK